MTETAGAQGPGRQAGKVDEMYFDTFEQSKRHQAALRAESEHERLARKASRRATGRGLAAAAARGQSPRTSGVASGLVAVIATLRALAAREAASSRRHGSADHA